MVHALFLDTWQVLPPDEPAPASLTSLAEPVARAMRSVLWPKVCAADGVSVLLPLHVGGGAASAAGVAAASSDEAPPADAVVDVLLPTDSGRPSVRLRVPPGGALLLDGRTRWRLATPEGGGGGETAAEPDGAGPPGAAPGAAPSAAPSAAPGAAPSAAAPICCEGACVLYEYEGESEAETAAEAATAWLAVARRGATAMVHPDPQRTLTQQQPQQPRPVVPSAQPPADTAS
jgi:hypothetical protein